LAHRFGAFDHLDGLTEHPALHDDYLEPVLTLLVIAELDSDDLA
jgi:hypothetical protein